MEFNRVIHELIDTKFADFGQSLVIVFLQIMKTYKNVYISYGDNGRSISSVLETQAFKPHFVF